MPRQLTITEIRLKNISTCVAITANTLDVLVNTLKISALAAISNTTQSLLKMVETIKQDKDDCAELMEHIDKLLNAIIGVYLKSDTGAELPPSILNQITKFTETTHKIHAFVEAQQSGSKVKKFFRQGELNALLKNCKAGLQQGLAFFQIRTATDVLADAREMQDQAQLRHQEVLNLVETMSSSDSASFISKMYSGSYTSSNSLSMLPAEPKIFHGRDSELAEILKLFSQGTTRIAILGAGGMGKTSLARAALHHEQITTKYQGNRFFIACDTASSKVQLAGLIGAHLGMKAGKDLTQAVLWHFSNAPPSLLILDNLETPWEPVEFRQDIEEFLSLLTDITSLALMITMRGAERPSKVHWTRPFLLPLKPLAQDAARKMFIDIADNRHSMEQVDQVLHLTDNMPLSISLLAHLVDMEGCSEILSRWETEKTSLISDGYDKRSNLELSISLSLSSPRITSMPHSQDLLALLSILPDGLSDVELKQSEFPIKDILGCKAALLRAALAYTDDHKRLKALVPVREYMGRLSPPTDQMIRPLLAHFHELLELYATVFGKASGALPISRITLNYTNIQNVLHYGLQREHLDSINTIYCMCYFSRFSMHIGRGTTPLLEDITSLLPSLDDHRLKAYVITHLFISSAYKPISQPETLIAQALDHLKYFDDPELEFPYRSSMVLLSIHP
ncbi:P-loop containing nucleoside triphosphate hydrolase protein [Mycena alexandri]|uniref:P-loop containing nucleoside triphosphate hydrolase protein n=1 Tax=Mycena alexandri TaxID=1745969 RepID=A0AAD6SRI7_9AGAR|nr:P-loop containing nucleoside triphosphate hydrolase protein [Mycena alexandri]